MGQLVSSVKLRSRRDWNHCQRSKPKSTALICLMQAEEAEELDRSSIDGTSDFISDLPDGCLACIFQSLSSGDRKRCSLVCRWWLVIEGQSHYRLSLNAQSDLHLLIPSISSRFDAVTKLALKCDRRSVSIGDEALVLFSEHCRNMTRLKLRSCRDLTDAGMSAFAKNCRSLKKLCCGSCTFGAMGMNAMLDNCPALKCSGDWDKLFPLIVQRVTGLVEIHKERIQVSDVDLAVISNCSNLEIFHLVKTPECTNFGLAAVAEKCKLLRNLHANG
ncbi:Detected protein of confused Function [Hibiscus syriacus]|uniref:Detected protein of confused Function n=1 Tax=Hibiscus syriacus TaxID=106335 RepID=A0A6A2XBH4_HIBSY|nr:Detected protein of confused Function [Hibiscus syriacus]